MTRTLMLAFPLLAALAAAPAAAAPPPADDGVFVEGARYTAVLDARAGAWRLIPADGRDVVVRTGDRCRARLATLAPDLASGLWLVSRDAAGAPELVALSSTPLPTGHPGRVALVPCDAPAEHGVPVPPGLVAWLQQHSGTVHVID